MKTKRKVLIGVMALALAGGISTAFAMGNDINASKDYAGVVDGAIVLSWGSTSLTDHKMAKVDELTDEANQYRYLDVRNESTKSVAGTVTLSFKTKSAAANGLVGLTIKVYPAGTEAMPTSASHATYVKNDNVAVTLLGQAGNVSQATESSVQTTTFSVTAGETAKDLHKYYIIEFAYSGAQQASGITFGGGLEISQSFNEGGN